MSQQRRPPDELSNRELLERIASYDPEKYPVVEDARRALPDDYDEEGSSS